MINSTEFNTSALRSEALLYSCLTINDEHAIRNHDITGTGRAFLQLCFTARE